MCKWLIALIPSALLAQAIVDPLGSVVDGMTRGILMASEVERVRAMKEEMELRKKAAERKSQLTDFDDKLNQARAQAQIGARKLLIEEAARRLETKYPDFDSYQNEAVRMASMFRIGQTSWDDYLEGLYVMAKYASFSRVASPDTLPADFFDREPKPPVSSGDAEGSRSDRVAIVNGLFTQPEFRVLPLSTLRLVVGSIDPYFASLSRSDQDTFLRQITEINADRKPEGHRSDEATGGLPVPQAAPVSFGRLQRSVSEIGQMGALRHLGGVPGHATSHFDMRRAVLPPLLQSTLDDIDHQLFMMRLDRWGAETRNMIRTLGPARQPQPKMYHVWDPIPGVTRITPLDAPGPSYTIWNTGAGSFHINRHP